MESNLLDWKNLPFAYTKTPLRFVSRFRGGVWEEGSLTEDASCSTKARAFCNIPNPASRD